MKLFRILLLSVIVIVLTKQISAQTTKISDPQLFQIIAEANQRGMSQQELVIYAKSKGYSEADINALIQKDNSVNSNVAQRQIVKFVGSDLDSNLTKEENKIFGYDVFHNKGMSFTPNLNMATPKDYIVGPGDELIVQIYGIAQATINLKVNPEGKVVIPNVGVSHLAGLSIEATKSLLTQKIGSRYAGFNSSNPNSFLMLTLSNIRTIKVNIVGEVKSPGTFQLPSFTTCFNALYAAGGPTVKGSFRNIQLYRGGKQIAEVDLYDFLLKGKTDKNIRLEDNDVLLVPQYGKRVEISGEVRRNLFFEIKEKETISNLIDMANGFTTNAYRKLVTIQRYNGSDKSIINLDEQEQSIAILFDGDFVFVGKSADTYKNRIKVVGSVIREGDYELKKNFKIIDLINEAGGLKPEAFKSRAILYRSDFDLQKTAISIDLNKALENDSSNNLLLKKEDLLEVSSIYDIKENYFVSIQGEVNQTGIYPYSKGMTLGELVLKSKGFKDAASGSSIEIVRRVKNSDSEIVKIIKAEINSDLSISINDKITILEPFDQVFIRASVGFRELKKVYVQGETKYTGQFIMDRSNMTLGALINRAGGVLSSAYPNGAILIRRTIFFKKIPQKEDFLNNLLELRNRYQNNMISGFTEIDKLQTEQINKKIEEIYSQINKSEKKWNDINSEVIQNVNKENSQKITVEKEIVNSEYENIEDLKTKLQSNVFKNLSDVSINENQYQFVAINLEKIINKSDANKFDFHLEEGDILYVPTYNETVTINGDVLYPVSIKFVENAKLKYYVNQAGGFNNTALSKRSYVVEANGLVKRTKSFLGFNFYPSIGPGSTVFVPKNNKTPSILSFDKVLGLVSSLVTTYLLVKNLSQ